VQGFRHNTRLKLNRARDLAGVPFVVNSAYRCKEYNRAVGGSERSAHTKGYAMDIKCLESRDRFKILNALLSVGFKRIGVYGTFIHVDDDPTLPTNVIWYG